MGDDRLKMEEMLGTHTGVQARIHIQAQAHLPPCEGQHWHLARDMMREREREEEGGEEEHGRSVLPGFCYLPLQCLPGEESMWCERLCVGVWLCGGISESNTVNKRDGWGERG